MKVFIAILFLLFSFKGFSTQRKDLPFQHGDIIERLKECKEDHYRILQAEHTTTEFDKLSLRMFVSDYCEYLLGAD